MRIHLPAEYREDINKLIELLSIPAPEEETAAPTKKEQPSSTASRQTPPQTEQPETPTTASEKEVLETSQGLTETEQAFANAGLEAMVNGVISREQVTGKISAEAMKSIMVEAVGLKTTLFTIAAPETSKKIVLMGYDSGMDTTSNVTARSTEVIVNKYLDNTLIEVRATGTALVNRMKEEAAKLKGQNSDIVVITVTGDVTLNQLSNTEKENLGKILDVENIVSANEIRPIPVIGLYDLVLRIAYGQDIERDILPCLNRIASKANGDTFKKTDIERLLSQGLLRIIPRAMPVNMSEATEIHKAAQAVAQAL